MGLPAARDVDDPIRVGPVEVGILVAEMMGVKAGLGWYITWAKSWASYDKMFAALFVICMIFTFVTKALNMVKKYALRWQVGMVK